MSLRQTRGSIRSGGYQFMRGHHATLTRGETLKVERLAGGEAKIVALEGGRVKLWDVCGSWVDARGTYVSSSAIAHDQLEAEALFIALVRQIVRGGQEVADAQPGIPPPKWHGHLP